MVIIILILVDIGVPALVVLVSDALTVDLIRKIIIIIITKKGYIHG